MASAIHLIVQIARFSEDGSRKITRIAEARGLDDNNRYRLADLFVSRLRGRTDDGRLVADLEPTGERPSFAREPIDQGMGERVRLTKELWAMEEKNVKGGTPFAEAQDVPPDKR